MKMHPAYSQIRIYIQLDSNSDVFVNYFNKSIESDVIVNIQKIKNQLIITIGLSHINYAKDLLEISRLYYMYVIKRSEEIINSIDSNQIFRCYFETPYYETKTTRFLLNTLTLVKYEYEIKSNYIKSTTNKLLQISMSDKLKACLFNIYQIILMQIAISNQHIVRHEMALQELKLKKSELLLDIGCGNGSFIFNCADNSPQMSFIGVDFDFNKIEYAQQIKAEKFKEFKINFFTSNILSGINIQEKIDSISLIEVIEHLDINDLDKLFENVFRLNPISIIFTTPNSGYNVFLETDANNFRHKEHKFEFTEEEFIQFVNALSLKYNYYTEVVPIGFIRRNGASISQMAILTSKKKYLKNKI